MNRQPSHSIDAEKGILSSILVSNGAALTECEESGVSAEWFYIPAHRVIYSVLCETWAAHRPIDFISVGQALRDQKRLAQVGGDAFITELQTFVPTAANIQYYIDIIRDKHVLRGIESAAKKARDRISEPGIEATVVIAELELHVASLRSLQERKAAAARVGPATPSLPQALDATLEFLKRYVRFSRDAQPLIVALWCAHTWTFEAAEFTPYLQITSPEKRSGKSRLMDCLELLTAKPWRAFSPTEAVLFRKVDHETPTLLLDEVDALFANGNDDKKEPIRALLNAGYERGMTVPRCVRTNNTVQDFSVFCAKAFAGIGSLPDTISDRSLPIRLIRKSRDQSVERFRKREAKEQARSISAAFEAWAQKATIDTLRDAKPTLPEELSDRQADICEPLLAIADMAGGDWPNTARNALTVLCAYEEDERLGTKLLVSIRDAFHEVEADRITTAELLDCLIESDTDAPWAHWWEKDLRNGNMRGPAARLAHLLRPFGIKARVIKLPDGSTARGYMRSDFEELFKCYCSYCPQKDVTM